MLDRDISPFTKLEELVLDRNKLKAIEPNVFAPDNFPQL